YDPALGARGDDVCIQMYTSGTTGLPKGVELTNLNFVSAFPGLLGAVRDLMSNDVFLLTVPLFHIAGVGSIMVGFLIGYKTVVLRDLTSAVVLEVVSRERITAALLVPTMIKAVLADAGASTADLSSLRLVLYGASAMPSDVLRSAMERFKDAGFVQFYGLTET